jgi:murein DD-endopeptidase MepM/ murein hydrolase activator NlpD
MTEQIQSGVPAAATATTALSDVERKKVAELAHQFESMLMTQMLREMRKSMLTENETGSGLGASAMTDTVDVELGSELSRTGGFGLSDMLIKAFDRQAAGRRPAPASSTVAPPVSFTPATATRAPAAPVPAAVAPAGIPSAPRPGGDGQPTAAAAPVLPDGPVSSSFGWRADPFNGRARFHSGTDVKMAYGKDVLSAATGRVSFVGEQSGYGLMVRIDHGNGLETRYAHLSQSDLHAGDTVKSGQVIARSGNSGRSTGPHLHFEVLENGRAVAPETMGHLLL